MLSSSIPSLFTVVGRTVGPFALMLLVALSSSPSIFVRVTVVAGFISLSMFLSTLSLVRFFRFRSRREDSSDELLSLLLGDLFRTFFSATAATVSTTSSSLLLVS